MKEPQKTTSATQDVEKIYSDDVDDYLDALLERV